ncbi:hypothetical protein BC938DRAFT_483339 [Jimgerdemannia flammicorona]|uniref:Uncharacterized protein n=1 Tax=Jimgerdemannia flammicorona TaxID=994334 RepID=A0A433QC70_9FUNG|nr:hypothetical protein BC938DRAFT_483339 [Jimgerdemannia flammicorona]
MTATKWMPDSFKLAKTMHDMLVHLCQLVQSRESIVVGLVHSAMKAELAWICCRAEAPGIADG